MNDKSRDPGLKTTTWTQRKDGKEVGKTEVPDPVVTTDTDMLRIEFSPRPIARSDFPHPLVTADFDEDDRLIGATFAGPVAASLAPHTEILREAVDILLTAHEEIAFGQGPPEDISAEAIFSTYKLISE